MTIQPEHEGKSAAPDSEKPSDKKAADDNAPTSKAEPLRLKFNLVASYAMHGFAPVVAVLALIIAVIAVLGNKSSQAQISKADAKIASMNANLTASKSELAKLRAAISKEKAMQAVSHNKKNEDVTKIVQNVTQLQVKMKISPTLEAQLNQPASATAVTPSVASAAAATTAVSTGTDKKPGAKVQAIKESIEKFNKQ